MSRKSKIDTLTMNRDGWCEQALRQHSPNCDARPDGARVDLLVIHNISLPPGQFGGGYIQEFFANRLDCRADPYFQHLQGVRVSAHFLIDRKGRVVQFVSANDRAWHAGASEFAGRSRCNDFSIGVELEGTDFAPFEAIQYERLVALTRVLAQHFPIIDVVGHEHIAPGRKTDPGPHFDWSFYRNALADTTLRFP